MKELNKIKPTKTTEFILPLLGKMKQWYGPWLINAYLGDFNVDHKYPNSISVLMKYSGKNNYFEKEEKMIGSEHFIDSYDLFKGEFVMYIFRIPEEFLPDYNLIMKGKYSQVSDEAKKLLLLGRGTRSPMPYILERHPKMVSYWETELNVKFEKDQEVWSIINIEEEFFDKETFPYEESVLG